MIENNHSTPHNLITASSSLFSQVLSSNCIKLQVWKPLIGFHCSHLVPGLVVWSSRNEVCLHRTPYTPCTGCCACVGADGAAPLHRPALHLHLLHRPCTYASIMSCTFCTPHLSLDAATAEERQEPVLWHVLDVCVCQDMS